MAWPAAALFFDESGSPGSVRLPQAASILADIRAGSRVPASPRSLPHLLWPGVGRSSSPAHPRHGARTSQQHHWY